MKQENNLDKMLFRWRMKYALTGIVIIFLTVIAIIVLKEIINVGAIESLVFIGLAMAAILCLFFKYMPKKSELISLLNNQLTGVEHSTHLLTLSDDKLGILQQIQKTKVSAAINEQKIKLPLNSQAGFFGLGIAGVLLFILALTSKSGQTKRDSQLEPEIKKVSQQKNQPIEIDTLRLDKASVYIAPPSYTKLKSYSTKNLELSLPERSSVTWHFDIYGKPDLKHIIFEDSKIVDLNQNNKYSSHFSQSSYYNYRLVKGEQELVSSYFPIKIIEDKLPELKITDVKEHQRLPYKENYDINFGIEAIDDYGLQDLFIIATLAKGTGESVKFREKQIELKDFKEGLNAYNGHYSFSTRDLEMEPGDELYFYVTAKDNCPFEVHWNKSTTHFVIMEDTTQVTLVDGGGMQLDLMPDFFRSQRQIIIDTEKLVEEKDSLTEEEFKQRSNELGYDQKLLRLKYGQFLGEEAESGLDFDSEIDIEVDDPDHDPNHDHSTHQDGNQTLNDARSLIEQFMHDHDHEEEENQLLETKGTEKIEEAKNPQWVKDMSHSHDNTEEATFFDMSIKSKLRAALTEMWDSELQLRLYHPEESLPYQYKCLTYLEDIKSHARVYVQRIGFEPPIIKEEDKRLTGNLKEVYSTRYILKADINNELVHIKAALPIIYKMQQTRKKTLSPQDQMVLQKAGVELSQIAVNNAAYLPVLSLLKGLINNQETISDSDLSMVMRAFHEILPTDKKEAIASSYFRHPINVKAVNEYKKVR